MFSFFLVFHSYAHEEPHHSRDWQSEREQLLYSFVDARIGNYLVERLREMSDVELEVVGMEGVWARDGRRTTLALAGMVGGILGLSAFPQLWPVLGSATFASLLSLYSANDSPKKPHREQRLYYNLIDGVTGERREGRECEFIYRISVTASRDTGLVRASVDYEVDGCPDTDIFPQYEEGRLRVSSLVGVQRHDKMDGDHAVVLRGYLGHSHSFFDEYYEHFEDGESMRP